MGDVIPPGYTADPDARRRPSVVVPPPAPAAAEAAPPVEILVSHEHHLVIPGAILYKTEDMLFHQQVDFRLGHSLRADWLQVSDLYADQIPPALRHRLLFADGGANPQINVRTPGLYRWVLALVKVP